MVSKEVQTRETKSYRELSVFYDLLKIGPPAENIIRTVKVLFGNRSYTYYSELSESLEQLVKDIEKGESK